MMIVPFTVWELSDTAENRLRALARAVEAMREHERERGSYDD